ncbi:MAG: hypothetical protein GX811_08610 [Lentisphaerae bacterium]|nr:hypothetical protein [Lentisphaerota bacterium]
MSSSVVSTRKKTNMQFRILQVLMCLLSVLLFVSCEGGGGGGIADGHDFGENDPNLYVALGDSITEGYGLVNKDDSYTSRLSAYLGLPVANEGKGGNTTADAYIRVKGILRNYKPGFLLIMLGTNDLIHSWPEDFTVANLRAIIQVTKSNKTIPVIATIPPAFGHYRYLVEKAESLNNRIIEMAKEEGAHIVHVYGEFEDDIALFQTDGLHPNEAGQALIAVAFIDVLK